MESRSHSKSRWEEKEQEQNLLKVYEKKLVESVELEKAIPALLLFNSFENNP